MADTTSTTGVVPTDAPATGVAPANRGGFMGRVDAALEDLKEMAVEVHGTVVTILPFIQQIEQQFAKAPASGVSNVSASGQHTKHA